MCVLSFAVWPNVANNVVNEQFRMLIHLALNGQNCPVVSLAHRVTNLLCIAICFIVVLSYQPVVVKLLWSNCFGNVHRLTYVCDSLYDVPTNKT